MWEASATPTEDLYVEVLGKDPSAKFVTTEECYKLVFLLLHIIRYVCLRFDLERSVLYFFFPNSRIAEKNALPTTFEINRFPVFL